MEKIKEYVVDFQLTGGECDSRSRMPMTLMVQRVIDVATLHANYLGVGYADLTPRGEAWVLSRISIEMLRYPGVNEHYRFTTWVASFNRRFSERDFEVTDSQGRVIAYARTIWLTIRTADRSLGDLSFLTPLDDVKIDRTAPLAPFPRLLPLAEADTTSAYRFRYTDIDINRHVNTVAYLRLVMDQWTLDWYDSHEMAQLHIAFMHEAYYDQSVDVEQTTVGDVSDSAIVDREQGRQLAAFRINWRTTN